MINSDIDIEKYHDIFQIDRIVTIPNFMDKITAEKTYNFLNGTKIPEINYIMPESWWYYSIRSPKFHENVCNIKENQEKIRRLRKEISPYFERGELTFCFKRTIDNHCSTCACMECQMKVFFKKKETIDYIDEICDLNLTNISTVFASCYQSNNFLSTHTDQTNGKISFVWNLTKNWKPQFGGNFFLLESNQKDIKKTLTPSFNSLTLFEIKEPN